MAEELNLGPVLLGVLFEAVLYGILIVQTFLYFQSYNRSDPGWTRLLVWYLLITETVMTGIDFAMIYGPLVTLAGTERAVSRYPKLLAANPIVTVTLSTPVQLFMARRIWILGKSKWLPLAIALASLCAFTGGIASGVDVAIVQTFQGFPQLEWSLNLWLVSSAVCDAIITVALVWFLSSRRSGFTETNDLVNKIIRLTVQTGLITSICAITNAFLCAFAPFLSMNFLFAFGLSKLYTNSLLSTLNARRWWSDPKMAGSMSAAATLGNRTGQQSLSNPEHSMISSKGPSAFIELETHVHRDEEDGKRPVGPIGHPYGYLDKTQHATYQ
ncbi:hypothetical protein D9756_010214 [Leucocoprinus leucothites]|uniref:DUF6534 domain-containing protein n=1 Tax=Leucocoprinus leucothites TaxID=201217 RepID=A0A8H5CUQ3_9AGAR|nr:hypothetical protein D9756_010214 [Leucoagaricus leucothites]